MPKGTCCFEWRFVVVLESAFAMKWMWLERCFKIRKITNRTNVPGNCLVSLLPSWTNTNCHFVEAIFLYYSTKCQTILVHKVKGNTVLRHISVNSYTLLFYCEKVIHATFKDWCFIKRFHSPQSAKSKSTVSLKEGLWTLWLWLKFVEFWDVMNFQQGLIKSTEFDFLLLNYPPCLKGTRRFRVGCYCFGL